MKIVQINTYDVHGGAAKAAYRLLNGLKNLKVKSKMIVLHKEADDSDVVIAIPANVAEKQTEKFFLSTVIQEQYINAHRTNLSNTFFSLSYPGYDLSALRYVRQADIINLHWIAFYQSPLTLHRLFSLGKPVVWTLHDMLPFTGGCHYSAGCDKYQADCLGCPQLSEDDFGLTSAILRDKLECHYGADLTIVSPSRWLADCARRSILFKRCRIEVIPNSLETDVFKPSQKTEAKRRMGLDTLSIYLLFVAEANYEKRKGFAELLDSLRYCLETDELRAIITTRNVKILCIGYPCIELTQLGIPIVSLGYLNSEERMVTAYSAADIFILPSLEDNLPNTMLESMSCGTPIVAFDVGGISDTVENNVIGKLVPVGDIVQLAKAIVSLISDDVLRNTMGKRCRQVTVDRYSLEVQARNYLSLFNDLLPKNKNYHSESITDGFWDIGDKKTDITTVMTDTALGTNFKSIYHQVLNKGLKEYAPVLQQKYEKCEADKELIQKQLTVFQTSKDHGWICNSRLLSMLKRTLGRHEG